VKIKVHGFRDDAAPDTLYTHYSGEMQPQPVAAVLDTRDGGWTVSYWPHTGNTWTEAMDRGEEVWFDLTGGAPTVEWANRFLINTTETAQRILDAYESGSGWYLDDDPAEDTPEKAELRAALAALDEWLEVPEAYQVLEVDRDWLYPDSVANGSVAERITAHTENHELEEIAESELEAVQGVTDYGLVVCYELADWLAEYRDALRVGHPSYDWGRFFAGIVERGEGGDVVGALDALEAGILEMSVTDPWQPLLLEEAEAVLGRVCSEVERDDRAADWECRVRMAGDDGPRVIWYEAATGFHMGPEDL
jgi:hypothetical protein